MDRCALCGRTLKDPKSIKLGYGPTCYRKYMWGDIAKADKENDGLLSPSGLPTYDIPGQVTIEGYLDTDVDR